MKAVIESITNQSVQIVNTKGYDWIPIVSMQGWIHLLRKLDQSILQAHESNPDGMIIIFAHSIGGILARIYLLDEPFPGEYFQGRDLVTQLVTLGSPHSNKGGVTRGGLINRWINEQYPGGTNQSGVKYTSVAGKSIYGDNFSSTKQHWVYHNYQSICGRGNVWGDGLIPVECALLEGSDKVVLDGVSHAKVFGNPWYGEKETVERIIRIIE